ALTIADHAEQHEKQILEYTRAIAFLGTPYRGSDLASWGTIAGNMVNLVKRTNTAMVEILEPSSEVLENVTQGFHTMLRSRERANKASIEITCFVEELLVTKASKLFMVVPSKSAILERYFYATIHADHIGMTKFEGRNNDYRRVYLQLKRWIKQIDRSLQDPSLLSYLSVHPSDTSIPALHPVKKNYRKVHVTILYWEADELQDVVQRISDVFNSLYHYEVREVSLPHRQKVKLAWPWADSSIVDERDLQIIYYLGSTIKLNEGAEFQNIAAFPARQLPAQEFYPDDPDPFKGSDMEDPRYWERYPKSSWLSTMISMPQLDSDVLVVLDCFIEVLVGPNSPENIPFLYEDDNSWARYLILSAGYTNP
ncbi:hypothetical protein MMC27_006125, partial [Xylographa pallens]|nr:hypothetical protein [Xylographa pallens]